VFQIGEVDGVDDYGNRVCLRTCSCPPFEVCARVFHSGMSSQVAEAIPGMRRYARALRDRRIRRACGRIPLAEIGEKHAEMRGLVAGSMI